MSSLQTQIDRYLEYCKYQKRLDAKTLKAYRIDLTQFLDSIPVNSINDITPALLEDYIAGLHQKYKPKTVKRKIASTKALFHYFEYRELLDRNPFSRMHIRFREPVILPRTIPLHTVESLLSTIYRQHETAETDYQRNNALRDIAVIELLFATGMRISELCALKISDVNLCDNYILIYGKGSKERKIQIGNDDVVRMLIAYKDTFKEKMKGCKRFFVNQSGRALSDQSVRRMINKYAALAAIDQHITPHMFRHTFATSLLEADVDIRYIQEMLGHSSINITEVYTHVAMAKQRDILSSKHPRKDFHIQREASTCFDGCSNCGRGPA